MKMKYQKESEIETCLISILNKNIRMRASEKIVKKDHKGRAYLRAKIEYDINNFVCNFYTESDIIDFLKNGEDLGKAGFVYAFYCLIGKAFYYSELDLKHNRNIDLLKDSLEKSKIFDGNAGINIEQDIFEICKQAHNFLIRNCKFTDSDLAFMPEILLEYLNNELNYIV